MGYPERMNLESPTRSARVRFGGFVGGYSRYHAHYVSGFCFSAIIWRVRHYVGATNGLWPHDISQFAEAQQQSDSVLFVVTLRLKSVLGLFLTTP